MRFRAFARAVAFLAALATLSASGVFAATIFSDDFNRANGNLVGTAPVIGTGNWTQTGTTATNPIQISSNAVAVGPTGQDAFGAFSSSATNTGNGKQVHTSMDINVSAVGTGDYFTHLSDPAGTTSIFLERVGAAATTGGYFLTLAATAGGGATTSTGTTALSLNQTYHLDLVWTFNAGPDTITLSVNGTPYLSKTWDSTNPEPGALSAFNFRQGGGAASAPTVSVDNVRVESIPEPSTLVLVGLGCLLAAGRRRAVRG
jgi:hypothetical protein